MAHITMTSLDFFDGLLMLIPLNAANMPEIKHCAQLFNEQLQFSYKPLSAEEVTLVCPFSNADRTILTSHPGLESDRGKSVLYLRYFTNIPQDSLYVLETSRQGWYSEPGTEEPGLTIPDLRECCGIFEGMCSITRDRAIMLQRACNRARPFVPHKDGL